MTEINIDQPLSTEAIEISKTIQDAAQYRFKQKIAATLRFDGKTIEKTDRTPGVFDEFKQYYQEEISTRLKCSLDDQQITLIAEDAFEHLIGESSADFYEFKKRSNSLAKLIYLLVFIIIVVSVIFYFLGWNIKM